MQMVLGKCFWKVCLWNPCFLETLNWRIFGKALSLLNSFEGTLIEDSERSTKNNNSLIKVTYIIITFNFQVFGIWFVKIFSCLITEDRSTYERLFSSFNRIKDAFRQRIKKLSESAFNIYLHNQSEPDCLQVIAAPAIVKLNLRVLKRSYLSKSLLFYPWQNFISFQNHVHLRERITLERELIYSQIKSMAYHHP